MTTESDRLAAIETGVAHCRPGGIASSCRTLRETFRPSTDHGGQDSDDGRAVRYLEWSWDPEPDDTTCVVDYAFLLRDADGSVLVEHDRHVEGLFARGEWLRFLSDAGFIARSVPLEHSELEPGSYEVFVCTRPGA